MSIHNKPVLILGAHELGKATLDIFMSNETVVYGFLDDDKSIIGTDILAVSVLGSTEDDNFLKMIGSTCNFFVAESDKRIKKTLTTYFQENHGEVPTNAIHNKVILSPLASVGYGNFINAGAVLGAAVTIGSHNIIHAGVVIDVGAQISDYVQIGSASNIGNNVSIGKEVFIGSGVTIVSNVKVGSKARIGAGSVVVKDVPDGKTVFGNPAELIAN